MPPRPRAERFRAIYAMLGLSVTVHKDGTLDVAVRGSDAAKDSSMSPEEEPKGGVMSWDGSG